MDKNIFDLGILKKWKDEWKDRESKSERENACKKPQASPKAERVSVHNLIESIKA